MWMQHQGCRVPHTHVYAAARWNRAEIAGPSRLAAWHMSSVKSTQISRAKIMWEAVCGGPTTHSLSLHSTQPGPGADSASPLVVGLLLPGW